MRNTTLTTLDILGKEWRVTHDFKPTKYLSWTSTLHLSIAGNAEQYGDRTPAILPSRPWGKLRIASAVNGDINYWRDFDQPPVGAWTTIAISQTLEGGKYMYRISIGGEEVHANENTKPIAYQGAQVYASKGTATPGSIKNLVIETKGQA